MSMKEKFEAWKARRKAWHEKFREEHPDLADFIIKLQLGLFVGGAFGAVYLVGYSDGSKLSPKAMQENFEKTEKEIDELHQKWLEEQRKIYKENFDSEKYRDNAEQFLIFAENVDLQPGEAFFLWDENQFKGENLPIDPWVDHQVYGIGDPKFDEISFNPWKKD